MAKKNITRPIKYNKKNSINNKNSNIKVYYCMRSALPIHINENNNKIYKWKIVDELPYDGYIFKLDDKIYNSFKEYCSDYKLSNMDDNDIAEIWYCDLFVTEEIYYYISSLFDLLINCDEQLVNNIIGIFIK